MNPEYQPPEPFIFNPLKHNLEYIKRFISINIEKETDLKILLKEINHSGTSIMDVYSGTLTMDEIFSELTRDLIINKINSQSAFGKWAGKKFGDFKVACLSDRSLWVLKNHEDNKRYVHIFPSRQSPHTFRVKANTLKSALLYLIFIGKDYISNGDLNRARALAGLSPIKDPEDAVAITEMIEILRK